ncbi:MAG: TRAP transporter small permease subunit [Alphaproteobacteria bacterium]|nr:TRAP transporter small permease subunit [Alphaproteobacteria bacterium]
MCRLCQGIVRAAEALCAAMFAGVFVVFVYKIVMRYAAHDAVAWADEVSVVLFIWIVFLANGFVVEDRRQISFDLLYRHLGPSGQRVIAVVRTLLIGAIIAAALPGSLDYIAFLWREKTPVLLWRLDIVYACFGAFMVAVLVRYLVRLAGLLGAKWREAL